ncbi:MAG: DnaT-like ssDNA-binding domain-containing protein [Gammaproteobacteria bacterium]|jgi:hypothetical protein|nr:DnaT-like ssDNA-binding domain-containing protein [Gammaproteobacteria bacterium]
MTLSLPLPLLPDLAARYGLEEAVMLAVIMELVGDWQGQVTVAEQRVYARAGGLSRQQQGSVLAKLADQGLLSMAPVSPGLLAIDLHLPLPSSQPVDRPAVTSSEVTTRVKPASTAKRQAATVVSKQRGRDDELSRIFAAKEAQQAMLSGMTADWQPSVNILQMLTHNMQVSKDFALGLRDEFVVYYMDRERRESPGGWDQKFLKWVKKEHIQQQTATARAQQQGSSGNYAKNEEARYHAREQRQQLTDAVLDLGNTDW